jgi:hypothetical protein
MGTLEERINEFLSPYSLEFNDKSFKRGLVEFIEAEIEMAKETRFVPTNTSNGSWNNSF